MRASPPRHDPSPRRSRRRRILRIALAALAVLLVARFFGLRSTDRTAWPAPAPGVRLEPFLPVGEGSADACRDLFDPEEAAAILAALPPAADAPVSAYHRFQSGGLAALSTGDVAAIEARLGPGGIDAENGPWAGAGALCWEGDFMPAPDGAARYTELVGRVPEFVVLACFEWQKAAANGNAAGALRDRADLPFGVVSGPLMHGAGLLGRTAALQCVSLLCRETLMAAADSAEPLPAEAAIAAIGRLRLAESNVVNCAEALREDLVSIRAAVHAIYTGEGGDRLAASAGGAAPQGLHGMSGWVVRRLGGTEEATLAHLDALFSRLIANAENPYSPEGLAAGLPDWCRLKGRTPWTRDPVGSAIAAAYLRHASVAAAVAPTLRLELRAARLAIALRLWKDAHGAYPETLAELAAGEKPALEAADFADPFAPDGAPLRYGRDGDGWRFWSVGLDGRDGGGARDAFTAPDGADLSDADLVFTSHERAIRRAALEGAARR